MPTGDPFANLISPTDYAKDIAAADSSAEPASPSLLRSSTKTALPEPSANDRQRFERIMEEVLEEEKEEELPGILTKHIDFLLSVDVTSMTNDLIRYEDIVWLLFVGFVFAADALGGGPGSFMC